MYFPDTDSIEKFITEAMAHDLGDFVITHETDELMTIRTSLFDLQVYYKEKTVCRKGIVTTSPVITGLFVNDKLGKNVCAFSASALNYYQSPLSEWSACNVDLALEALF